MKAVNVHGTCVQLGAAGKAFGARRKLGVLLLGESGAGKSELALRMIADGAQLIADDRVDLFAQRGRLYAKPPHALAGLFEVRGLGIVKLDHIAQTRIDLVVRLVAHQRAMRMPEPKTYQPDELRLLAIKNWPPLVAFSNDVFTSAKIAVAAAAFSRYLLREQPNPPG